MNMRVSVASELRNSLHFHILKLLFLQYCVGTYDTLSQKYIFSGLKLHRCIIYYTINAVFFYYLWYCTMCINDSTPTKH